ncbi:GGDEF domain-containing protein [Pseudarthrobacter sp. J75]|uniref:GGDEF domain-containing protein n=1 Tax=unclassified Pseudarthrobacter TaxID=2647000 RepID=UPI002E80C16F|nr:MULTISPECIES: GGDEF domain-containing protein [unclassified Pseudarthrobacter]MEE2523768.1 GGDEF domain-containing protein [Pseudarthrobacter sp. J47]MEE2529934.1 GGDEF domain-containing protein [Pseudarthrobacter sp. J75]
MVLDIATLRIGFSVMAVILVLLFYFSTYRSTRSPYSGWWCVALLLFLTGSFLFLLDGIEHQTWANPLGNALLVAGAVSVWFAARSLQAAKLPRWAFAAGPLVTAAAGLLDNPATNVWAGGAVFLGAMGLGFGLVSRELWRLSPEYSRARTPMAAVAAAVSVYYLLRLAFFLLLGPDHPVFTAYFGSAITTLIMMVMVVVVSYSMAGLSSEQQTRALQEVANADGLTGLLNRAAFMAMARRELERQRPGQLRGALVLADLDHFKAINDNHGHAAGDVALQVFAGACRDSIRSTDLVGRYGGEEFILLLPGVGAPNATRIVDAINQRLSAAGDAVPVPTVSYGIALYDAGQDTVEELVRRADAALYEAKSQGRNRIVVGRSE